MSLVLKRILLISLLCLSISGLAVYSYYHSDGNDVSMYMNIRDQSDDYDRLFDNYNFKTFTISFEEVIFDEMITNMDNHFEEYGDYVDNTMYPVDITYSDSYDSFTIYEVGFRTKSTTSRNVLRTIDYRGREVYHQTTFQLQFNETFYYEDNTNMKTILKTREVFNLEQLNFEYSQLYDGDYDEAMISETFTHYLYSEADILVANSSYGIVYLKIGEDIVNYGFFSYIETIDSEFLKNNFKSDLGGNYGDLYKVTDTQTVGDLELDFDGYIGIDTDNIRYTYSLRNNTLDGERRTHSSLTTFIEKINDLEYFKENYEDLIDYDRFARYLAISFLVGNTDDLRYNFNNYYLYFDVYDDLVTFIPFDLDNTLGFGKHLNAYSGYGTIYSIYFNLDNPSPLIESFFSVDELSELYESYILEFIDDFFNFNTFSDLYLSAKSLYETILTSELHLGNNTFDLRNTEWYFNTKISNVLAEIQ